MTVHARGACREIYYSLSGAVGLLSGLSGVGAVGTVERLSGSCRVWVSECRARAQGGEGEGVANCQLLLANRSGKGKKKATRAKAYKIEDLQLFGV